MVNHVLVRVCRRLHLAEEADAFSQEMRLFVLTCGPRLQATFVGRNGSAWETYLFRVFYNHGIDWLRRRQRRGGRFVDISEVSRGGVDPQRGQVHGQLDGSAATSVACALRNLPPVSRHIIYRRYWKEDRIRDIAAALGLPPSVVSNRLARAIARIRARLPARLTTVSLSLDVGSRSVRWAGETRTRRKDR